MITSFSYSLRKTYETTFFILLGIYVFGLSGCNSTRHNSTPAVSATKTLGTNLEPSLRPTNATSTPTILAKKTETPTAMVSFNSLSVGEYLVLRGNDSHSKKNALYLVTSEGLYVGKLAEGHDFAYAAISPNQEWLAYVNGFNENSVLHVEMISTGEDFTLSDVCKYPSWSPDSQYLTAACGEIIAFSFRDGKWKQAGNIPLPDEFVDLPANVIKSIQLISPSWSSDGKSIAYLATFAALPPENSVLGPYISSLSCLVDKATCNTYKLDVGEIHPRPILQWFQSSDRIAIYSFINNQSELYLFDTITKKLMETISLTNEKLIDSFVFSPSGEFLAFKPSADSAFIMNVSNKKISKIIAPVQNEGSQVLFWIKIVQ